MLRALLFLIKVGVLVAAAVWIADRQGSVVIGWDDYRITVQTGFFLFGAIAVILLAIFIYRLIQLITSLPRTLRRTRALRRQAAGYKALASGLAAVAAGDTRAAIKAAERAHKFLPADQGLPLLLQAQAARLQGREEQAQTMFQQLTHHKQAGFLGVRGLLQAAMDRRDYERALDLARQALRLHPQQGWIIKLVYDLEIRQQEWDAALVTLGRALKAGVISSNQVTRDRGALYVAQAECAQAAGAGDQARGFLRMALKADPGFVPATLLLAKLYAEAGQSRAAIKVLEHGWRAQPHPDLASLWQGLQTSVKSGGLFSKPLTEPMARLAWAERLVALSPQHPESHLAAGIAAAAESLWGEARDHFRKAEALEPSGRLYKHWIALERRAGANPRVMEALQEKWDALIRQDRAERRWVCRMSGRIYDQWMVLAPPHGAFNTIEWVFPGAQDIQPGVLSMGEPMPLTLSVAAGA